MAYGQDDDIPNGIAQEMFVQEVRRAASELEEATEE